MVVIKASESPYKEERWLSTGLPALDMAIGNGIPAGRITEIVGQKSSGKTTLVLTFIKNLQEQGIRCVYADAEQALDYSYAEKLGVDLDKLEIILGEYGEDYLNEIASVVEEGDVFVVLDSLDALVPKAMTEAEAEQQFIGVKARMISSFLPKIVLPLREKGSTLLIVNQERTDIMTGRLVPAGGKALQYYKSVQVRLYPTNKIKKGDSVVGIKVKGKIEKNKVGMPFREFESNLIFGEGFSAEMDIIDLAVAKGILVKEGAWYLYNGEKLAYGTAKLKKLFDEDKELFNEIKELANKQTLQ